MNDPQRELQPHEHHLQAALEQARRLSASHRGAPDATGTLWSAQAAHVGDLSVLALALRN